MKVILDAEKDEIDSISSKSVEDPTGHKRRRRRSEDLRKYQLMLLGFSAETRPPEKKWYIIYPENRCKLLFDLIVAVLLLYSCNSAAVQMAFINDLSDHDELHISNLIVDFVFILDIILTFFTAIKDKHLNVTDDIG